MSTGGQGLGFLPYRSKQDTPYTLVLLGWMTAILGGSEFTYFYQHPNCHPSQALKAWCHPGLQEEEKAPGAVGASVRVGLLGAGCCFQPFEQQPQRAPESSWVLQGSDPWSAWPPVWCSCPRAEVPGGGRGHQARAVPASLPCHPTVSGFPLHGQEGEAISLTF